jgi:hypothetical protein
MTIQAQSGNGKVECCEISATAVDAFRPSGTDLMKTLQPQFTEKNLIRKFNKYGNMFL